MMTGLGFMGIFGGLLMLLFLVALLGVPAWLVWMLVSKNRNAAPPPVDFAQRGGAGNRPTAREILEQRYARGEIDREEYTQIKRDLA